MNRIAAFISNDPIPIEELSLAKEIIQRDQLVKRAIEACKKTIYIPEGASEVNCYEYTENDGKYQSWGIYKNDGWFICYSNWGGDHEIG